MSPRLGKGLSTAFASYVNICTAREQRKGYKACTHLMKLGYANANVG
ncbi:MAG: hypothetical protein IH624_03910 [Phycisphaerae bacterium]|nr:hypothetical protein [Phycisphaerae bacterium]